jgi:hypothetical protein
MLLPDLDPFGSVSDLTRSDGDVTLPLVANYAAIGEVK